MTTTLLSHFRASLRRLRGLFPSQRHTQEFADEIDAHLRLHIDDNLRRGMNEKQARREAILKLGGIESTRQSYRERMTVPLIENFAQDVLYALRQLGRNLGFTITAIVMLALGIGASVAIFAFVDAALLKPLPYRDPTRLVAVTETVKLFGRANLSYPDYLDWKRFNHSFQSLEIFSSTGFMMQGKSGAEPVPGIRVSDGIFRVLGITPMLGRDFYAGEDLPGVQPTVILSYKAWKLRFGSRPDIIGQVVELSGVQHTIVGVLPDTFQFALRGNAELWVPYHAKGECDLRRSCHGLDGIARLKDGVSIASAQAEMEGIAAQLEQQYPGSNRGQGASVVALSEIIVGSVRPILITLLTGAGMLLVIACVNVASLLLVRSESRRREIAVRGALGASRARLLRQFMTESLLLVALGSLSALGLALAVMRILTSLIPKFMMAGMPFLQGLGLNWHVCVFALAVSVLAAMLFAITPILRLPLKEMRDGLTEGSRGSAGTMWRRFGANLVVLELAIAVVLLVGAGLLGKSFYRLLHVGVNFNPEHLALVDVMAPESLYPADENLATLQRQLVAKVAALPGVQSAGLTSVPPVSFNGNTDWIRFVGRPYNGIHNEVNARDITPDYLRTLQAKLLRGRFFTDSDDATKPKVAIINQTLAKMYYPDQDPIGKRFGNTDLAPDSLKEIVGVIDDVKEGSLDSEIWPAAYYPMEQDQDHYFTMVVRTSQSEASILPSLVSAIHSIDPGLGADGESTMEQHVQDSPTAYLHRSSAWLVGGFAALALLLGVVGLYGVIAYSVSQRTREIGVRMALGAQRGSVYGLVMGEAGKLTFVGIAIGLASSVGAATLMRKLLFGTDAWDVTTLASVAIVLGACAMLASYIPAHRAASVNPVEALRAE
jgi:predicted permease